MEMSLPARQERWLRVALVGLALVCAVAVGFLPASRVALLPGLALLIPLAILILMRHLQWGFLLLVPLAFLVDVALGTRTSVKLNATYLFTALLLGAWLLKMLVVDKRLRLAPSPVNLPALLFLGASTLAWIASFLPWVPLANAKASLAAQFGGHMIYALSIGTTLMVMNVLQSKRLVQIFTWMYLAFGIIYVLVQVIPWSFEYVVAWFVDAHYGNTVFWTLTAALAMAMGLFHQELTKSARGGLMMAASMVIVFGLLKRPEWISGWLPPIIAVVILLWLKNWRLGLVITLLASLALFQPATNFINQRVNTDVQQWSTFTRFATWSIVFELIKVNPITGLGPGNYPFYTLLYRIVGNVFWRFNTHNNYFDIALQYGLLGLGLFAWMVAAIFKMALNVRKKALDGFSQAFANAMVAGLIAILISGVFADWFLPFVYNIGLPGFQSSIFLWLFCGGLGSLYIGARQLDS
jgi:O-antigen ligase